MAGVLDKLASRAEDAKREAARLEKMLELARELGDEGLAELVALFAPESQPTPTPLAKAVPDGPRGREAIRIIVAERPGIWTLKQLRAEMEARGWFTSASGLEAAAKRLCAVNREGRRIGKGQYVFPANFGEEDAIESDRSGGALIPFTSMAS